MGLSQQAPGEQYPEYPERTTREYEDDTARPDLRLIVRHPRLVTQETRDRLRLRATMLGVPYLHLPRPLSPTCAQLLPYALAQSFRVVAVGATCEAITLAFDEPWTERKLCRLRLTLGLPIFPVLTSAAEIDWALGHWPEEDPAREG